MATEVKFAMPIGHKTADDYGDYQGKVNLGPKPFRQPLTFDGQGGNFVHGIDFVLDDVAPVPNLFALVESRMFFKASDTQGPDRLILKFHEERVGPNLNRVFQHRTMESPPIRALYEGIHVDDTKAKLKT